MFQGKRMAQQSRDMLKAAMKTKLKKAHEEEEDADGADAELNGAL